MEAERLQRKRKIDNPGKLLEEEGPWFDWIQDWVKTGWATTKGINKMMKNITELEGILDGENKQQQTHVTYAKHSDPTQQ